MFAEMKMLEQINRKISGYDWVRAQGVPTVDYTLHPDPETALEETTLDRFVLKPAGGHSSQGVYVLTRTPGGGYDCAMTGRHYANDAELAAHYEHKRELQTDQMTRQVIVETLIEDSFGHAVPLDYKVYAFASGTPLIMQRHAPMHQPRHDWAFEFYDAEGRVLGPVRQRTPPNRDNMLRAPDCLGEIVEASARLVRAAGVSFVRVDMYATPQGPVFGEFTPVPNNAMESFEPEMDAVLGQAWTESLEALGLDYFAPLGKRRPVGATPG